MESHLHETLRRLDECLGERRLSRSDVLDPANLSAKTALPVDTVHALLRNEAVPPGNVEERVTSRIKALTAARLERTGKRMADLVTEVAAYLDISPRWARMLLTGEKMPNVTLLHDLANFFDIEGGEAFFTASPAEALNRVALQVLNEYETPDPLKALLERHGVVGTDLRLHGDLTPEQLKQVDQLLGNVLRTILPPLAGDQK